MRSLLIALLVLTTAPAVAADAIDLSRPWGNKSGCINKDGQEVYAEDMLLLTKEAIVTSTTACRVTEVLPGKNGATELNAMCQAEGEEAETPFRFIVSQVKKKPPTLLIKDAGGETWGEVTRCR